MLHSTSTSESEHPRGVFYLLSLVISIPVRDWTDKGLGTYQSRTSCQVKTTTNLISDLIDKKLL